MAIKVLGVDHIHCNSRDLKASRDLLAKLFDSQVTPIGHLADLGFYNASVYLEGAEGKQAFLDLFQGENEKSFVGRTVARRGACVTFIAFRVADLAEAAAHAASLGLTEISRDGYGGMRQIQYDTLDLFGFMLEFVAYDPGFWEDLEDVKAKLREGETIGGLRYVDL